MEEGKFTCLLFVFRVDDKTIKGYNEIETQVCNKKIIFKVTIQHTLKIDI